MCPRRPGPGSSVSPTPDSTPSDVARSRPPSFDGRSDAREMEEGPRIPSGFSSPPPERPHPRSAAGHHPAPERVRRSVAAVAVSSRSRGRTRAAAGRSCCRAARARWLAPSVRRGIYICRLDGFPVPAPSRMPPGKVERAWRTLVLLSAQVSHLPIPLVWRAPSGGRPQAPPVGHPHSWPDSSWRILVRARSERKQDDRRRAFFMVRRAPKPRLDVGHEVLLKCNFALAARTFALAALASAILASCATEVELYEEHLYSPDNSHVVVTQLTARRNGGRPAALVTLHPTIEVWSIDRSHGRRLYESRDCRPLYIFWDTSDRIEIVLNPGEIARRGAERTLLELDGFEIEVILPTGTQKEAVTRALAGDSL
jgi:hypothetical protein